MTSKAPCTLLGPTFLDLQPAPAPGSRPSQPSWRRHQPVRTWSLSRQVLYMTMGEHLLAGRWPASCQRRSPGADLAGRPGRVNDLVLTLAPAAIAIEPPPRWRLRLCIGHRPRRHGRAGRTTMTPTGCSTTISRATNASGTSSPGSSCRRTFGALNLASQMVEVQRWRSASAWRSVGLAAAGGAAAAGRRPVAVLGAGCDHGPRSSWPRSAGYRDFHRCRLAHRRPARRASAKALLGLVLPLVATALAGAAAVRRCRSTRSRRPRRQPQRLVPSWAPALAGQRLSTDADRQRVRAPPQILRPWGSEPPSPDAWRSFSMLDSFSATLDHDREVLGAHPEPRPRRPRRAGAQRTV